MWLVRLALRRPYTFVVMSILIALLGAVSMFTSPPPTILCLLLTVYCLPSVSCFLSPRS